MGIITKGMGAIMKSKMKKAGVKKPTFPGPRASELLDKEFKKRKFKNIIASTGLTAAAGTFFFLTTFSLGGDFYFGP